MLRVTSRVVAETQDKDPLSGSDEGSGDVVEGGFCHADVVDGPGQVAGHHLAIGACLIVFYFVLVLICSDLLLWIEYVISKFLD
jgi:hypothetical protein